MENLAFLCLGYVAVYLVYLVRLAAGFAKVPVFRPVGMQPATTFSIVVPIRNEAGNLEAFLESYKRLEYPADHFELILIDDGSTDQSAKTIYQWRLANGDYPVTLIENVRVSPSPKKDAIARAVPIVKNRWIVTTDADCILPGTWLSTLNDFIVRTKAQMVAAPVHYAVKWPPVQQFQRADALALQGVTIGSFGLGKPFMCNGANFAYMKDFFLEIGGFDGIDRLASGDDVLLLQKAVQKHPEKVHYLKSREAVVATKPVSGWLQLFNQRVRWASKSAAYQNDFGETLAAVAFLGNFSLVGLAAMAATGVIPIIWCAVPFASKWIADYVLALQTRAFLRKTAFFFPVFSGLIYPLFATLVGFYSFYGRYHWKGRSLR
jgi:cellulose synthase/poly-beta-1,6-N-acetylglucosamine synthase-like glycosyltransferase